MAHGVVTPLARVVGPLNAEIAGEEIPVGVSILPPGSPNAELNNRPPDCRIHVCTHYPPQQ